MGSIYNEAMWGSTTQRWPGGQHRRTLQRDEVHHREYLVHGHSRQHASCVAKPLVHMAREHAFTCILHCMGWFVLQFVEALCGDLDKVLRDGIPSVSERARTGIGMGSGASPNGEEVYPLLQLWEQVRDAACLDTAHAGGRAVLDMRELL